jgi:preprotein translocase subunit SecA
MANNNQIELVVTVEVDKANQSIKSVNANLNSIETAATKSARAAASGIDGMTASMVKGATAGNLLADAIRKAIDTVKEWTIDAAKQAAQEDRATVVTRALAKAHGDGAAAAQKAVEAQNFESRKHLLEYDDVMNKQREAVYGLRRGLLEGIEQRDLILEDYVAGILSGILDEFAAENVRPDQWNIKGMQEKLTGQFGLDMKSAGIDPDQLARHELGDAIFARLKAEYEAARAALFAGETVPTQLKAAAE